MLKKLLLLFLCVVYAFGLEQDFLEPDQAFKTSFEKKEDRVVFKLNLGKDIYLYDDKLKFFIKDKKEKINIRQNLTLPTPVKYEQWQVHFTNLNVQIPYVLIQSKTLEKNVQVIVDFQGCSKKGLCYAPMTKTFNLDLPSNISNNVQTKLVDNNSLNETDLIANTLKNSNIFFILATFFGFGLLLSLTPCVFPMIPILSSIIVKAANKGKLTATKGFMLSLVYVLSMAVAYTIAGVLAGLFGANLQVALQNPYVLVGFSAIFVLLAFSMFGYFKLELPQSFQSRINSTSSGKENQGVFGIAIMGFLSALIVGPCVAPPLAGALVYIGQTGNAILGGAALFVMSLGMGAPLLLIGLGAGKYMPKPGGWMESITKLFGIIMLGVAIWMLSRVIFPLITMYLWAFLLIGTAIYLKIFNHIIVKTIATIILVYGILLFIGAVSKASNPLNPLEKFTSKSSISNEEKLNITYVKNNDEINEIVKNSSKPVMLDFYARWCVSCKELENITFKDKEVIAKLKQFKLIKADVTKNNEDDKLMQKRFGVVGPPALIFWDKDGNEIKAAQIVGYKNPEEFLKIVNKHF